ncbi:MAG: serine hydrolase domain-containing protein [Rehaibacterium terrae]|uniref:serine hydrolase domain-containing protein n=1 Tax=Rehaibacterium terrae TaxID=1341696 RepID=UPI003918780C
MAAGFTFALLLAAGAGATPSQDCIAAHAEAYRRQHAIPALSLAIARDGHLRHASAHGHADLAGDTPLTPQHRLRIASVSKPLTALAVLRLVEDGALALDERVFGHRGVLGARHPIPPNNPRLAQVTVRHLLEHSAGFGGWDADPMFAYPGDDPAELVDWVLRRWPLVDRPGARFRYANFGYFLLGRIVEARSGQAYEDFVRERLLRPAGAAAMSVGRDGEAGRQPDEVQYADGPASYRFVRPARLEAHGGWIATPGELLRVLAYLHGETEAAAPLRPATVRRMLRASAPDDPQGRPSHYGLGWEVTRTGHGHLGAMPGTLALLFRRRDGLAYAALANRLPPDDVDGRALQAMLEAAAAACLRH